MCPKCDRCQKELRDWQGNIMISEQPYHSRQEIKEIGVLCKQCTNQLDATGVGQQFHNIWELSWLKEHPVYYLGSMLTDLVSDDPNWTWRKDAVHRICSLVAIAHPELSKGLLDRIEADKEP
ncbi:MAG: hypothetical protein Kow00121_59420 [Elainellaceae cyanobacterium]